MNAPTGIDRPPFGSFQHISRMRGAKAQGFSVQARFPILNCVN